MTTDIDRDDDQTKSPTSLEVGGLANERNGKANLNSKRKNGNKALAKIFVVCILIVGLGIMGYHHKKVKKAEAEKAAAAKEAEERKTGVKGSNLAKRNFAAAASSAASVPPPTNDNADEPTKPPVVDDKQEDTTQGAGKKDVNAPPEKPPVRGEKQSTYGSGQTSGSRDEKPNESASKTSFRISKSGADMLASKSNSGGGSGGGFDQDAEKKRRLAELDKQVAGQNQAGLGAGGGTGGGLESLSPTSAQVHYASVLRDREWLVTMGTVIECTLQTKIVTAVAGKTRCVLPRNIYSDDGKMVLLEKGSEVTGEYQSGIKNNQPRIFVLWTRIKTPSGVVVNLDSPGTGSLGEGGVDGYIDTHFWQRFGGAIMVSLIEDWGTAEANKNNGGGTNVNVGGNGAQAGANVAAEILKSTVNIPATLYKNQGSQLAIYMARDLNFKTVYDAVKDER